MAGMAGGIRAGRAFVELGIHNRMEAGLRRASRRVKKFGQDVSAAGRKLAMVGVAGASGFALAVKIFTGFDDEMRKVQAVSGATGKEFDKLTAKAKLLGRTTSFTAGQVAGGMTELGRAGFSSGQIDSAIGSVLNLARATDTELAEAARIAAASLRGFGLEADQMGRVSDVLTTTANSSATTLVDLGEAMKMVAPLAAEAGIPIEDTAAALGVLANNGIRGTMAGTAVARSLKNLANAGKRSKLEELIGPITDKNGDLLALSTIMQRLGAATRGMGSAQRLEIFEQLFGRGSAAALKLSGPGAALDDLQAQIDGSAGSAAQAAALMDAGLGGSFRRLMSAAEGVALSIGEALAPTLSDLAERASKVAGVITAWITDNKDLIVMLAGGVAAALALGGAMMTLGLGATVVSFALGGLAMIASVVFGPTGLIIGGVIAATAALLHFSGAGQQAMDALRTAFSTLGERFAPVIQAIRDSMEAGDIGAAAAVLWSTVKLEWARGIDALLRLWEVLKHKVIQLAASISMEIAKAIVRAIQAIDPQIRRMLGIDLGAIGGGLSVVAEGAVGGVVMSRDKIKADRSVRRTEIEGMEAEQAAAIAAANAAAAAAAAEPAEDGDAADSTPAAAPDPSPGAGAARDQLAAGQTGAVMRGTAQALQAFDRNRRAQLDPNIRAADAAEAQVEQQQIGNQHLANIEADLAGQSSLEPANLA